MNWNLIKTIFLKDWKELIRSKQAVLPMVILPLLFVVAIPLLISYAQVNESWSNAFLSGISPERIPQGLSHGQSFSYVFLVYTFAPFFLAIPVMLASVIASTTFAGEKERKTLEGLLYTPLTDRELILAKIFVAFIPSYLLSIVYFVTYSIVVNLVSVGTFHYIFFPTTTWVLMVLFLAPTLAFLALSLIVAVSQRVASIWEAQQITVILILPLVGLLISQAVGTFTINPSLVLTASAVLGVIDFVFFRWIVKTFDREHIVTKLV